MNEVCKVDFHGNEITVIEKDEQQYVAMKPIVEAMGLKGFFDFFPKKTIFRLLKRRLHGKL